MWNISEKLTDTLSCPPARRSQIPVHATDDVCPCRLAPTCYQKRNVGKNVRDNIYPLLLQPARSRCRSIVDGRSVLILPRGSLAEQVQAREQYSFGWFLSSPWLHAAGRRLHLRSGASVAVPFLLPERCPSTPAVRHACHARCLRDARPLVAQTMLPRRQLLLSARTFSPSPQPAPRLPRSRPLHSLAPAPAPLALAPTSPSAVTR